ncbi:MAG: DUF1573 domain-containing protein [bacterium]
MSSRPGLPPERAANQSRALSHSSTQRIGFLLLCLLTVLGTAGENSAWAQGARRAVISVQPDTLDFGSMISFQRIDTSVTIRNSGDALLIVSGVESACGCTVPDLEVSEIEPGKSTEMKVTFDSEKLSGLQFKTVKIMSNDPQTPTLELSILADIHVPVRVDPILRIIGFNKVRRGQTGRQEVTFTTQDVAQLAITPVRFNDEIFDVEVVPGSGVEAQRVVMNVTVDTTAPVGDHREFIRVETNVADMPVIDIEAFVNVVQDLFLDKNRIRIGYVQRDQAIEQAVRVRASEEGVRFKITGAEIDLPDFEVEIEETIENLETLVVIKGRPLLTSDPRAQEVNGRMKGTLRIFTDLPQQPELEVSVSYLLKL